MRGSKGLPRWLWTFFWDVDPKALDPVEYRDFILTRLLARGDRRAWKWVRRHWTEEELREFLLRTRGRGIDEPERLTFYALMPGIPYETVRGWLGERRDSWSRRSDACGRGTARVPAGPRSRASASFAVTWPSISGGSGPGGSRSSLRVGAASSPPSSPSGRTTWRRWRRFATPSGG